MKFVVFTLFLDGSSIAVERDNVSFVIDAGGHAIIDLKKPIRCDDCDESAWSYELREDFFTVVSRLNTIAG